MPALVTVARHVACLAAFEARQQEESYQKHLR
jgi:hypothetical protein